MKSMQKLKTPLGLLNVTTGIVVLVFVLEYHNSVKSGGTCGQDYMPWIFLVITDAMVALSAISDVGHWAKRHKTKHISQPLFTFVILFVTLALIGILSAVAYLVLFLCFAF